jgi:hypothetical protein
VLRASLPSYRHPNWHRTISARSEAVFHFDVIRFSRLNSALIARPAKLSS